MADVLKTFQVAAQVEHDVPPVLKVFQVIAQVEYEATPEGTFKYYGNIPVTAIPSCAHNIEFNPTTLAPVTVTPSSVYYKLNPGEFVYFGDIGVTVLPAGVSSGEYSYTGSIPCAVTPSCDVVLPIRFYEGNIGVEVTPVSACRQPIVGWDKYTGYGIVDITFLSEDPPFWGVEGNLLLTINPAAASITKYGETVIPLSTGGFEFGGEGVWASSTPQQDDVVAEGGYELGGEGVWASVVPESENIISTVGFKFGGEGVFVDSVAPSTVVVGSGGFVLAGMGLSAGGTPPATVIMAGMGLSVGPGVPATTVIVSTGGWKLGGIRPDAVEVTYPESRAHVIQARIAFEMGGEGACVTTIPPSIIVVSDGAVFALSGDGIAVTTSPPLAVITGDGGFALSGTGWPVGEIETYALTGNEFGVSLYANFPFNAYAQFRGKYYGAGADGIYLLEGADDAGGKIHPGVRVGPTNLGTSLQKRLRVVSVGEQSNGARVRVKTGDREGTADVVRGHAFIARNLQGAVMTIDILEFDTLSHLEVVPLVLSW